MDKSLRCVSVPTAKRVRKSKATDAHDRVCYVLAYSYASPFAASATARPSGSFH